MDMEADDGVHHLLARGEDRASPSRQRGERIGERRRPLLRHQQRQRLVPGRAGKPRTTTSPSAMNRPLPPHEIALAHVAIGGDARVVGVGDGLDPGHGPRSKALSRRLKCRMRLATLVGRSRPTNC